MKEGTEIIVTTDIKAEKGFIYPTGRDERGCLIICKVKAGRKPKVQNETKAG